MDQIDEARFALHYYQARYNLKLSPKYRIREATSELTGDNPLGYETLFMMRATLRRLNSWSTSP